MTYLFERRAPIGILGGGQLALMLHEAATRFELQTHVYCQKEDEPAAQQAHEVFLGAWDETEAIERFARSGIKWLLCEFENAPAETVELIGRLGVPVHSLSNVLARAQRRESEKGLANSLGIPTPLWTTFNADGNGKLRERPDLSGWPMSLIAKTNQLGYDGKGQESFETHTEFFNTHWEQRHARFVLEERIDIDFECSVFVARNAKGDGVVSQAVRNRHTNRYGGGVLYFSEWHKTAVPARFEKQAREYAARIAEHLKLVGVLCAEFFVTRDGRVLFNEMAPRPHNSFHGTIEGSDVSQFEQYILAVTGLPLRPMKFIRPWAMFNLLGEHINLLPQFAEAGWRPHGYGKSSIAPGRKMGHVTMLAADSHRLTGHIRKGLALTKN